MNELDAILTLNAVPGLGNIRIRKLIEQFGSARNAVESIPLASRDISLDKEYALVKKHNARIITFEDADYPQNLREIPDAPIILYVKGNIAKENNLAIAIVGSRHASLYGTATAEKFSMRLADLGITVVSGLARGIDTAAHQGALKAKGKTIAVLGCGLAHIYPPENKKLFEEIAENGAVVSEFSMETPPHAGHFPRRNRIISGLSLGVVVVEASLKSGALITSRFALEQNREVFAVPGSIDNPNAEGTHSLIKQGAKLISNVDDILEELFPHLQNKLNENQKLGTRALNLNEKENRIYKILSHDPIYIDNLLEQSQVSLVDGLSVLLSLELQRLVKQLPGKYFIRN